MLFCCFSCLKNVYLLHLTAFFCVVIFICTFRSFSVVFWTVWELLSSFEALLHYNPQKNHWETLIRKRRHARRARAFFFVNLILPQNLKSLGSSNNPFQCLTAFLGQKSRLRKNACHFMRNEFMFTFFNHPQESVSNWKGYFVTSKSSLWFDLSPWGLQEIFEKPLYHKSEKTLLKIVFDCESQKAMITLIWFWYLDCVATNQMQNKTTKKASKLSVSPSVMKPHFGIFSFRKVAVTL